MATSWTERTQPSATSWTERTQPSTEWHADFELGLRWDDATMTWADATFTWGEAVTTSWTERTEPNTSWTTPRLLAAGTPIGLLLALTSPNEISLILTSWTERTKP